MRSSTARLALVVAAIGWGLATTGTKYALGGLDPMVMLATKLTAASAALWLVLLTRGGWSLTGMKRAFLLGLFEPALAYGALTLGLLFTSASNASAISVTESCFVLVLAWMFLREGLSPRAVAGIVVAGSGVLCLGELDLSAGFNVGDGLILAASFCAAVYVILAARTARALDPLTMTTFQFTFATLLTYPVAAGLLISGHEQVPTTTPLKYWAVTIVVGGIFYAGSFALYNSAIRLIRASFAGVILNLVPVLGVLSAAVLLHEHVGPWQLLGTGLVTVGVFLVPASDAPASGESPSPTPRAELLGSSPDQRSST